MRLIVAATTACLSIVGFSVASEVDAAIRKSTNIPAQELGAALRRLAADRNFQMLYRTELIGGLLTPGASGELTSKQALEQLLDGTGLTYRYLDEQTVTIVPLSTDPAAVTLSMAAAPAPQTTAHNEAQRPNNAVQLAGPSATPSATILEEVIVTAQKRTESIMDVPSSITVLSAAQLENMHATQLVDYAAYAPGLNIDNGGTPGQSALTMRGLGLGSATATVGTYIDDTPFGSSAGWQRGASHALDLLPYDLARIEILRGPQGTLYGANAMGGLLKYVTRAPDLNEFEARMGTDIQSVSESDDTGWGGRIGVNAPLLSGTLGVRGSYFRQHTPGYVDNPVIGASDVNVVDQQGGRLSVLWQPRANLSIKFAALLQDIDADDTSVITLDPVTHQSMLGGLSSAHAIKQPFTQRLRHYSGTLDWNLGWADFISASSYSVTDTREVGDNSATLGPLIAAITGGEAAPGIVAFDLKLNLAKFTQEFRLASPTGVQLEWLVGAFYTREDGDNLQSVIGRDANGGVIPGLYFSPVLNDFAPLDNLVDASIPSVYEERAVFANATYKLTDKLSLGAGFRWAKNEQDFTATTTGFLAGIQNVRNNSSDDVFNYAFTAQYHFSDDLMPYVRVASGYRPGGPNSPLPGLPSAIKSDSIVSYETGLKWQFLERRALIDVAVYRIDWEDIQVPLVDVQTGASYGGNAGLARSQGVELATAYAPTTGLRLGVNAAYTDATLREDLPPSPGLFGSKGDQLPGGSKWSASATAEYEFPLWAEWRMEFGGGYRYVGPRYSLVSSDPNTIRIPGYTALDLSAGIANQRWSLRCFARNVTDERGYVSEGAVATEAGPIAIDATVLQPRTLGLSVDAKF